MDDLGYADPDRPMMSKRDSLAPAGFERVDRTADFSDYEQTWLCGEIGQDIQ